MSRPTGRWPAGAVGVLVAVGLGTLAWAALATALIGLIPTIESASPILTFTYLPVILLSRVWTNHLGDSRNGTMERIHALVRYRTGDLVRLPADWRGNGNETKPHWDLGLWRESKGVANAPDPARLIHGFLAILHDVQNIVRLQVVQEARDRVVTYVVPTADYSVADTAKIEMRARTKIPRSVSLEIRVGDSLRKSSLIPMCHSTLSK